jgi:hypothetical protein
MFKNLTSKEIVVKTINLLKAQQIDYTHLGYDDCLALLLYCIELYNIPPYEKIQGVKYAEFIKTVYHDMNLPYSGQFNLPYMHVNVRSGVYYSCLGLLSEAISYKITSTMYNDVKILQSRNDQLCGHDFSYTDGKNIITADCKTSSVKGDYIKVHQDWFKYGKKSIRFHIVDHVNSIHIICCRGWLHAQYTKYGNNIPLEYFKNCSFNKINKLM